jgi:RNA polymerase sigma-70 factor (ECF subfamily)
MSFKKDDGFESVFEILYQEYYDRVYKTAVSILLNKEQAEVAVQETFYKAFTNMDQLKEKSSFGPWVCKIARNESIGILRKKAAKKNNCLSIYDEDGNIREYLTELNDFHIPESIYEDIELRKELKQCIGELETEAQRIINLRYYSELTIKEIAECLGIKEGTVKSRLYRAIKKLADKLKNLQTEGRDYHGEGF